VVLFEKLLMRRVGRRQELLESMLGRKQVTMLELGGLQSGTHVVEAKFVTAKCESSTGLHRDHVGDSVVRHTA